MALTVDLTRFRVVLLGSVLAAAAVATWWCSLRVPFFFDDVASILENRSIRDLRSLPNVLWPPANGSGVTGRPIVNLSLALNYAVGGTDPRGYHVVNLLLHTVAGLTLFGLVRRTLLLPGGPAWLRTTATGVAFTSGLLWTLHPLQTESVSCVIQRTELLVGLFFLQTFYLFVRSLDALHPRRWQSAAVVACSLGMASKEVMVAAPLLLFLFDRAFVAGSFVSATGRRGAFHLAVAATWVLLGVLLVSMGGSRGDAAGFGFGVSTWEYLLKQCEAIPTYAALALWPHPLVLDYGNDVIADPLAVLPQGIALISAVGLTFLALVRWPRVGFLLFSFFAILAPSSSFVPLVTQTMAEHRMYLPLVPLVVAVGCSLQSVVGRRLIVPLLLIALAGSLLTRDRNQILQDELIIWADTIAKRPTNARAVGAYALALADRGRPAEAIPLFRRALSMAPRSADVEQNLGNAHFQLRQFDEAARHFRRAIALRPEFASAHNNLGATLVELGETTAALESYQAALKRDADHVGAHQNLARAYFLLGRHSDAAEHYARVVRARPSDGEAHYNLGVALAQAGEMNRAKPHFTVALRQRSDPDAFLAYARFLFAAGDKSAAVEAINAALRLHPSHPEARSLLEQLGVKP